MPGRRPCQTADSPTVTSSPGGEGAGLDGVIGVTDVDGYRRTDSAGLAVHAATDQLGHSVAMIALATVGGRPAATPAPAVPFRTHEPIRVVRDVPTARHPMRSVKIRAPGRCADPGPGSPLDQSDHGFVDEPTGGVEDGVMAGFFEPHESAVEPTGEDAP